MDCDDRFTSAYQLAVLNYNPVPIGTVPSHNIRNWHEAAPEKYGLQLNPLNTAPGVEGQYITAAELNSAQDDDPEILTKEKADHQFYLSYDFNPIDNLRFHGPHIPIRTGKTNDFNGVTKLIDLLTIIWLYIRSQYERGLSCIHPS